VPPAQGAQSTRTSPWGQNTRSVGSEDHGLLAGHVVRLGADVPLAIEDMHTQQLVGGIEMMRIGQQRLRGVTSMVVLANDTAFSPRCRQRLAFSPCAVHTPRQAG